MSTDSTNPSRWHSALTGAERATLARLERDCPDSIGLVARIADPVLAQRPEALPRVLAMIRAGLAAYRDALKNGDDEPERFGAFVDGLTDVLPRKAQAAVARALSRWQRAALARRLPPSQQQDTDSLPSSLPLALPDSDSDSADV
jgi:hypothetical protein